MPEKQSQGDTPWMLTNQAAGVFLSVCLLFMLASVLRSDWAFEVQPDGFILGFFPFLGIFWMLGCGLMLINDHHRKDVFGDFHELGASSWGWVIGLLLGWFAYMNLVIQLGFPLTTLIFMAALFRLTGIESWRSIAVTSVLCVIIVFFLFFVIGITLPFGEIWS